MNNQSTFTEIRKKKNKEKEERGSKVFFYGRLPIINVEKY